MNEEKKRRKATVREERFEMRLSAEEREVLERAAELGGETSSAFARRATVVAARSTVKKASDSGT